MNKFITALEKGRLGEKQIKDYLESRDFIVYHPQTEGTHWIDMLGIKGKNIAVAIDVKTKARLTYLPATGINQKAFEEYQNFSKKFNMPFYIIFVDEFEGKIYGNKIEELEKSRVIEGRQYPCHIRNGLIRIWPLKAMKTFGNLDKETINKLKELSQRNYEYPEKTKQLILFKNGK